jgi:hypothetical protein
MPAWPPHADNRNREINQPIFELLGYHLSKSKIKNSQSSIVNPSFPVSRPIAPTAKPRAVSPALVHTFTINSFRVSSTDSTPAAASTAAPASHPPPRAAEVSSLQIKNQKFSIINRQSRFPRVARPIAPTAKPRALSPTLVHTIYSFRVSSTCSRIDVWTRIESTPSSC